MLTPKRDTNNMVMITNNKQNVKAKLVRENGGEEVWEGFMEEVIFMLNYEWYIRLYIAEGGGGGRGGHSRQLEQLLLRHGNEKRHGMLY